MDKASERVIDELLVIRCQEGGGESLDLLMRRWHRPLWRYARRLTGSNDAAWDVMQETWLTILKQIRRLSDPAWFAAWAHRIVRNKCSDYWRKADRHRRLTHALVDPRRTAPHPSQADSRADVAQAMQRLTTDRQELLTLKYGGGLNIMEIALVLGIPVGTVKSRLHEARQQLKGILEGPES